MKIAAIDQRHLDRCVSQRFCRVESTESASDDDYAVTHPHSLFDD
jgi:hypothetical protein